MSLFLGLAQNVTQKKKNLKKIISGDFISNLISVRLDHCVPRSCMIFKHSVVKLANTQTPDTYALGQMCSA